MPYPNTYASGTSTPTWSAQIPSTQRSCTFTASAAPFGLSTAAIYEQLAQPLAAQRVPVQHLPQAAMNAIYRDWQARHAAR